MHRENSIRTTLKLACAGAALSIAGVASAQDADGAKPDHLDALKACQGIADPSARLTCFDSAVAIMVAATDEGKLRLVDEEDVRKTRRRLFGFSLPDLGIFGGDGEDDELDMLESTITRVVSVYRDTVVFEIEEGGVWQMSDAPARIIRRMESGTPVVFKKAALGSYFIRVDGQTGVKGRRIQ